MRLRRIRAIIFTVAVALSLVATSQAIASPSVKSMVLTKSDFPNACKLQVAQVVSNSYVEAHRSLTAAQVASYGRLTGYGNQFGCAGKAPQYVSSEAVEFKNSSGAHQYYALIAATDLRQAQKLSSFRRLSTSGIGSEAVGFSYQTRVLTAGNTFKFFVIEIFRRGRFLGTAEAAGAVGTWKADSITSLARVIDGRMKQVS
jgi:hypothetical protein